MYEHINLGDFLIILEFDQMVNKMEYEYLANPSNNHFNLQEYQRCNIANLLRYISTYLIPHNIPLRAKEKNICQSTKEN